MLIMLLVLVFCHSSVDFCARYRSCVKIDNCPTYYMLFQSIPVRRPSIVHQDTSATTTTMSASQKVMLQQYSTITYNTLYYYTVQYHHVKHIIIQYDTLQ